MAKHQKTKTNHENTKIGKDEKRSVSGKAAEIRREWLDHINVDIVKR